MQVNKNGSKHMHNETKWQNVKLETLFKASKDMEIIITHWNVCTMKKRPHLRLGTLFKAWKLIKCIETYAQWKKNDKM